MRWLVVVLISGCATELVWTRRGSSHQDFLTDRYACTQESRNSWSGGGTGLAGQLAVASASSNAQEEANRLFAMCMEARGWRLVEPEQQTEPKPKRPKRGDSYGFTGDACDAAAPCKGSRECVDGKCSGLDHVEHTPR